MATESESAPTRSSGRSGSKSKAEPETTEQATSGVVEMPVSQLIEGATAYLGHPTWTAAGALHDRDPDEMMDIGTAKGLVEKWLQKPVETPDSEE